MWSRRWWSRFAPAGTPPTVPHRGPVVFDVPTLRLASWVERTASDPVAVLAALRGIPHAQYGRQDVERVQAALVVCAEQGSLDAALDLLARDWRDVLVAGGLADGDWPQRLDELLR